MMNHLEVGHRNALGPLMLAREISQPVHMSLVGHWTSKFEQEHRAVRDETEKKKIDTGMHRA